MTTHQTGCIHGNPIGSQCPGCLKLTDAACRQFDRDVFFGKFDHEGYTPAERAAKSANESEKTA